MKSLKRISSLVLFVLGLYLGVGYFLHLIVFPEHKPDLTDYFRSGDVFYSQDEGLRQTVIKQENGRVYVRLDLDPYAPGPPMHIHNTFDELFEGGDKPVKLIVNKEVVLLNPGEKLLVPKGVPHKMLNDGDTPVSMHILESDLPEQFAVYLNQVLGI
jgi:quercetin dioxygenase-like cupin family protein